MTKKKKVLGYIVYNTFGPKMLGEDNVLWLDHSVTLFKNDDSARAAIKRSEKYAAKHGYNGDAWQNHELISVRGEK